MAKPEDIFFKGRAFQQLRDALGVDGFSFLTRALGSIEKLLPHLEADRWKTSKTPEETTVKSIGTKRLAIALVLHLKIGEQDFLLRTIVRRRRAETGRGAVEKTLAAREYDLCRQILQRTEAVLKQPTGTSAQQSLRAIQGLFVEHVVAAHLQSHWNLKLDISELFSSLRELAEQSYENKSLTYGLLIKTRRGTTVPEKVFPRDYFEKKRYRALSDGFRTAFEVDRTGQLLGLRDLQSGSRAVTGNHFFPEWCRYLANASSKEVLGVGLTRQGDILVFDGGSLRFSYRAGRWQYWNHTHAINVFSNHMRIQRVPRDRINPVVNQIYRVALDVSFRRSGCLFVLLRNRNKLRKLVVFRDAIGDKKRDELFAAFDKTLKSPNVTAMTTPLLVEISALDGGFVIDNQGEMLAYAAVLKTRGTSGASEGSRTKAAVSASAHGIAVKVSSDGDISLYARRKTFLEL